MSKKKKISDKRRAEAKIRKEKKLTHPSPSKPKKAGKLPLKKKSDFSIMSRPALSQMKAPPGYVTVSMSQGLFEYSKPLMDYVEEGIVEDPEDAFQIAMELWNWKLPADLAIDLPKSSKSGFERRMARTLKISTQEAAELFKKMIQRKKDLFPDDIQPDNPMFMYMKLENRYSISAFDCSSLVLPEEAYTPEQKDQDLVRAIDLMDEYLEDRVDYKEREDHYFSLEEECEEQFQKWLEFKRLDQACDEDFAGNIGIYLNFIYCYIRPHTLTLKRVLSEYMEEFFTDFLLRKVIVEPPVYTTWPPALKLFYRFLSEIGYMDDPSKIINMIDQMEPIFIGILKERYE